MSFIQKNIGKTYSHAEFRKIFKKSGLSVMEIYPNILIGFNTVYITNIDDITDLKSRDALKELVGEKKLSIIERYQNLMKYESPEQRTSGWYNMRKMIIGGSEVASVIGTNKYNSRYQLIKSKVMAVEFALGGKQNVHHGIKFEPCANWMYETMNNAIVNERGLIQHPTYKFLGASPDGVVSETTRDGKLNPNVGTLVEYKCVTSRQIFKSGPIKGTQVPIYYYEQMQAQLECCDLDVCHFAQYKIVECAEDKYNNHESEYKGIVLLKMSKKEKMKYFSYEYIIGLIEEHFDTLKVKRFTKSTLDVEINYSIECLKKHYLTKDTYEKAFLYYYEVAQNKIAKFICEYETAKFEYSFEKNDGENNEDWLNRRSNELTHNDPDVEIKAIYWIMTDYAQCTVLKDPMWIENHKHVIEESWKLINFYRDRPEYLHVIDNKLMLSDDEKVEMLLKNYIENNEGCTN